MSETTSIQWTDYTAGPHLGCTEVSSGCAHCYARKLLEARLEHVVRKAYRAAGFEDWETRPVWGDSAPRAVTKGFWEEVPRLNRLAAGAPERPKIFPSMIDWLDELRGGVIDQEGNWVDRGIHRLKFLRMIYDSPNLTWMLLTKRPQNFETVLGMAWLAEMQKLLVQYDPEFARWLERWKKGIEAPKHVWVGVSTENQKAADERIPLLRAIPAAVRFLSVEPMLERIDFKYAAFNGSDSFGQMPEIHLAIFGGESGPGARPCSVEWIRDGKRQFQHAGVPVFVKQLGARPVLPFYRENDDDMEWLSNHRHKVWNGSGFKCEWHERDGQPFVGSTIEMRLKDGKGGDMAEWPEDLRVREMPSQG